MFYKVLHVITCSPSLNTTICPYCIYSICPVSYTVYIPLTWHRSAVSTSWSSDPSCWSILPHLTTSIPGHHPCRVSPLPPFPPSPLPSFFRLLAGTGLAQRCPLPSLTHLKRDTQWRHIILNMACDCLCVLNHIAVPICSHMRAAHSIIQHKAQFTQPTDINRWPALWSRSGTFMIYLQGSQCKKLSDPKMQWERYIKRVGLTHIQFKYGASA